MPFKFPYTNFQELNLDWIIKKVKDLSKQIEDDSSIVSEYIDRLIAVEDKADNAEATAAAADARATGANNTANSALTLATQAKQTAEIADLSTTLLGLKIGDLSSLFTTAKDTIVNAINEVWSIFHNATAVTNVTPAGTDPAVTYSNGVFTFDLPEGGDPDAVTHAELDAAIDDVEDTIDDLSEALDDKADVIIDTASGNIASFPDGTATPLKSLIVNVEPVQDLHGYDSPWPAGVGMNKCNISTLNTVSPGSAYGLTVSKDVANGTITLSGTPTWTSAGSKSFRAYGYADSYSLYKAQFYVVSKSANVTAVNLDGTVNPDNTISITLSVNDTADVSIVVKPLLYDKNAPAPTAYSPYSNICPISGWDGVSVWDTGHNIFDEEWEHGYWDISNGAFVPANNWIASKNYISIKPNTQYFKYGDASVSGSFGSLLFYDKDKNYLSYIGESKNAAFTTPSNAYYCTFYISSTYENAEISINYPATETSYHAYTGGEVPVSFGTTVYGGEPDIISGNMPVTWKKTVFDGSEAGWTANFNAQNPGLSYVYNKNSSALGDLLTAQQVISSYVKSDTFTGADAKIGIYVSGGYLWIRSPVMQNMTDISEWRTYLSTNPLEVAYLVETPTETQITPTPITALKGYNAVWSDAGAVNVTYIADTKGYIDKLIAQVQALALGG